MYFIFFCFCLIEISVIDPAKYKLPNIREICICMLVYKYENEVLKKDYYYYYFYYHHYYFYHINYEMNNDQGYCITL